MGHEQPHGERAILGESAFLKIDEINRKPGAGIIEYRVARR